MKGEIMNKLPKFLAVGLATLSMGVVTLAAPTLPAAAKTKAAKVISTKKLAKTRYYANGGHLYTSTKLTKKAKHNFTLIKSPLSATKSAKVKKPNGKTATYYYVSQKKGTVKGWVWQGYLNRTKNYAQRRSDIRRVKALARYFPKVKVEKGWEDGSTRTSIIYDCNRAKLATAYLKAPLKGSIDFRPIGIGDAIAEMYTSDPKESRAILAAYNIFKGRFNHKTNAKLAKTQKLVIKRISQYKDPSDYHADFLEQATEKLIKQLTAALKTIN